MLAAPPHPNPTLPCPCRLGNAFTLWLGINPPELFFYAFLPPLLLDSALSIDYFLFNKAGQGCLPGWLAGCLAGWLAGCLAGPLAAWLAGLLAHASSSDREPLRVPALRTLPRPCHVHCPTASAAAAATALQVMLQVMVFAFLVVLLSVFLATPVLLYCLGLAAHGWRWQHGALFRCGGRGAGECALPALARCQRPLPCT